MSEEIAIQHVGFFNYSILNKLLSDFIIYVESNNIDNYLFKKVQIVMVEILENNYQYTQSLMKKNNIESIKPEFSITKTQLGFRIVASNPIYLKDAEELKSTINKINSLDIGKLKDLYKKKLKAGMHSNKVTAGIGLIRIAKVAKNKIDYSFQKIDNNSLYYTLEILINTK